MKSYSRASDDVFLHIDHMRNEYHHVDLENVTIGALFVYDLESTMPVLKHHGYPAGAVIRITPLRQRAQGIEDAVIEIDRSYWLTLNHAQRAALIDHELHHLERVLDDETGNPVNDAVDRPKLRTRLHDHEIGFFTAVAERHGENAPEVRLARRLLEDMQASTAQGDLFKKFMEAVPPGTSVTITTGTSPSASGSGAPADPEDADELYPDAVKAVVGEQRASISFVQRHLTIGYNRAARLVEAMEAAGIVGPLQADGTRDIHFTDYREVLRHAVRASVAAAETAHA